MYLRTIIVGLLGFIITGGAAVIADNAVCGNIRLSAAEQFQCRYRLDNALGPGDAQRTRKEFENKVRTAANNLITPPVTLSLLPPLPNGTLMLPHTPEVVPRETGALRLPNTPSPVPPNGGVLRLPTTPFGVPASANLKYDHR